MSRKDALNAGALNTRISIERRTSAQDEWQQPIPDAWAPVASVWANVRHLRGAEAIRADAVTSSVRASIRIRWRTGIDAGMRVKVGAAVYEITAVLPEMARREHVDLVCELHT